VPSEKNGRLLEVYEKFLSTESYKDYLGKVARPLRKSMSDDILSLGRKLNEFDAASELISLRLNSGGNVFAWSDQHFQHKNIIKYASRKFDGDLALENMNAHMVACYKKTVSKNDIVIFGGDVSFGSLASAKEMLKGLDGTKILVLGNHDFVRGEYRDHDIFDYVVSAFAFKMTNGQKVWCTHVPIESSFLDGDVINLHGHTHDKVIAGGRHVNMSVECVNYTPQLLSEILEKNQTSIIKV
jgi:calcineurin-like phosphoesterase family protein